VSLRTRGQRFRPLDRDREESSALPLDPHRPGLRSRDRARVSPLDGDQGERPWMRIGGRKMAGSGSENRQRQITLKARFTDMEAALIREQAERAGVSVASVIRFAVLDQKPLRASRQPTLNAEMAAQLLGKIGQLATALRACAEAGGSEQTDPRIEAAHRDLAEMRLALFEALGREP
jgi:hypothetical protein